MNLLSAAFPDDDASPKKTKTRNQALQYMTQCLGIGFTIYPIDITAVAEPIATREWVLMPADLWCTQRFKPRTIPANRAKERRKAISP